MLTVVCTWRQYAEGALVKGVFLVDAIIVLDKNKTAGLECIHGDVWACLKMEDSFVILVLGGGVSECAEQIIVVC